MFLCIFLLVDYSIRVFVLHRVNFLVVILLLAHRYLTIMTAWLFFWHFFPQRKNSQSLTTCILQTAIANSMKFAHALAVLQ